MISLSDIKQLTKQEKLHLMETIWHELSVDEQEIEVPESHKEMLDKRAAMVERGEAEFLDWEDAKRDIKKAVQ